MKTALITGVNGQDGHYLVKNLLDNDYRVFGITRRTSTKTEHQEGVGTILCDVTDAVALDRVVSASDPDEIYHLAALSHVHYSFNNPVSTMVANITGTMNVLAMAERYGSKVYNAATSEMFGTEQSPQNENTPFHPRSPYAVSKVAGYWATVNYREAYNLFACNGICYNHESSLRPVDFVTQKIVRAAVAIANGSKKKLVLGNLNARRDWGHASDYVDGMRLMLQQDNPDDYVLATGVSHSVRDFAKAAFGELDMDWEEHTTTDQKFERPAEVPDLCGDPSKAERVLGWKRKYNFEQLVQSMVNAELERSR